MVQVCAKYTFIIHWAVRIIELLSNGVLHISGVYINCKKKMSANEDKSEIARTADVASELSKMQLVCRHLKLTTTGPIFRSFQP